MAHAYNSNTRSNGQRDPKTQARLSYKTWKEKRGGEVAQ